MLGPTNSGKTHDAFERLATAASGIYLGPLRLLALEAFTRLNDEFGVSASLITGEERRIVEGSRVTASTIEMLDPTREIDVAVIDEIQMLSDPDRGWAWTQAVVGANAFAHESGIHQDGVLKHRETYEIMRAQDVGWTQNKLVLGKHSGRNAFKNRLQELGIELESDEALNAAFARFKDLADKKHEIFDEDLHALVSDELVTPEQEHYKLVYSRVCSETGEMPRASVILNVGGVEHKAEAEGGGPVDATFKAIESIAGSGAELLLYSVNAITTGTDAQGEVTTRLSRNDRIVNGNGADTDIVIASARSYLNALNKLHSSLDKVKAQGDV